MLMCVRLSFFLVLSFVCLVWLITGCCGFWCVGWVGGWRACSWPVLVCFFLFGEGVSCVGWCRAGPWCALGGLLGCCSLLFVFARCERCAGVCLWGGVCEWVFLVSVVVWVLGVLSGVVCCLLGWVMRLLAVV